MAALSLVDLARALIDIDSTTGREAEACAWLAGYLRERGFHVTEQPVAAGRTNVVALVDPRPTVVLSTHIDCVPPFFPSRVAGGRLHGRGACDAKGALDAHTDEDHVELAELEAAVLAYGRIAGTLLEEATGGGPVSR